MSEVAAQLERFSADSAIADILMAFDRDGAVIIEQLVSRSTISTARRVADRYAEDVLPGSATQGMGAIGKEFVGRNTIRFSSLATIDDSFFEILDSDVFHDIASAILLPNCGNYWLNTAQVMYIGPGEKAQMIHRDADNWWEYVRGTWPNSVEVTVSAMIGLDTVTEELGATRVAPGSQEVSSLEQFPTDIETIPAELGPGDALVYSGYVLHGGGANRTNNEWRRAMHMSVVAGWLTPEEASPLDFPFGTLAGRSERIQQMLGHRSYSPAPHRGGGLWLRHVRALEDDPD